MPEKSIKIIGCGYIGKKVAAGLNQSGMQPLCLVNREQSKSECENAGLKVIQFDLDKADLNLAEDIKEGFANSCIAYFSPPPSMGKVDTRMGHFISVLETLAEPVKKIVLISTTGVYGDCQGDWIDETRSVNPQAERAHRRVSTEQQLKDYCKRHQVPFIIFRVPGIYAVDKLPKKRITSGEPIVSAADSGFTNRIHAEDLAAFCIEALLEDIHSGIYNCCDGQPSTMNDYFMKVADALGLARPKEISLQMAQQQLSKGMLSYLAESKRISNEKLLKHFKTSLRFANLEAGLKQVGKEQ